MNARIYVKIGEKFTLKLNAKLGGNGLFGRGEVYASC